MIDKQKKDAIRKRLDDLDREFRKLGPSSDFRIYEYLNGYMGFAFEIGSFAEFIDEAISVVINRAKEHGAEITVKDIQFIRVGKPFGKSTETYLNFD